MALSNDLLTQFAKVVQPKEEPKKESTVYGTVVTDGQNIYVRLDGASQGTLTPVSTTMEVRDGERVTVMIKNHTATITGNVTSPAVRTGTVNDLSGKVTEFDSIVAQEITVNDLTAVNATITNLEALYASIGKLDAVVAEIDKLKATYAEVKKLTVEDMNAINATIKNLIATTGTFDNVSTDNLDAINAEINNLKANVGDFTYLSAKSADIKYANIDFTNIGKAAMEYFYAQSGLIDNVDIGDATISGRLVGVTISGDLIDANTIIADKLVIKGEDGFYYKLNYESGALTPNGVLESICYRVSYEDGVYMATEDDLGVIEGTLIDGVLTANTLKEVYHTIDADGLDLYFCIDLPTWATNQLHGDVIVAKSITAEKISVHDLVAFGATIGGFEINENSISSTVKDSADNTVRGIYMGTDGQFNFGDAMNYVRYYKEVDENGEVIYRLAISAESIMYHLNGSTKSLSDIGALTEYVKIGTHEYDDIFIEDGELAAEHILIVESTDPVVGSINLGTKSTDVKQLMAVEGDPIYYYRDNSVFYKTKKLVEPCIELGKHDSDFKMIITNTRIMFLEGDTLPAYISNQALHIEKAVIEDELQLGGFIWKKRANGNIGLMWKG